MPLQSLGSGNARGACASQLGNTVAYAVLFHASVRCSLPACIRHALAPDFQPQSLLIEVSIIVASGQQQAMQGSGDLRGRCIAKQASFRQKPVIISSVAGHVSAHRVVHGHTLKHEWSIAANYSWPSNFAPLIWCSAVMAPPFAWQT
eukprot:6183998-Pleurochrysis_carterae.AAC.9